VVTQVDLADSMRSQPSGGGGGGLNASFMSDRKAAAKAEPAVVVKIDASCEGSVQAVRHCNDACHSSLLFATALGGLHSYDLRARVRAWGIALPPQLGYVTAMELVPGECILLN
jgi:hypothetical protein